MGLSAFGALEAAWNQTHCPIEIVSLDKSPNRKESAMVVEQFQEKCPL